jgi:hypothetical protein
MGNFFSKTKKIKLETSIKKCKDAYDKALKQLLENKKGYGKSYLRIFSFICIGGCIIVNFLKYIPPWITVLLFVIYLFIEYFFSKLEIHHQKKKKKKLITIVDNTEKCCNEILEKLVGKESIKLLNKYKIPTDDTQRNNYFLNLKENINKYSSSPTTISSSSSYNTNKINEKDNSSSSSLPIINGNKENNIINSSKKLSINSKQQIIQIKNKKEMKKEIKIISKKKKEYIPSPLSLSSITSADINDNNKENNNNKKSLFKRIIRFASVGRNKDDIIFLSKKFVCFFSFFPINLILFYF